MNEPDLRFDENGFLTPYSPISSDLDTIKRIFVDAFPTSTTRKPIYERYKILNARLLELMPEGFTQWLDGSFVSRKTDPNDIDVLTFIDTALFDQHEPAVRALRNEFATGTGRVDVRTIRVYPKGHPRRSWYESDRVQWLFDWTRTNDKTRRKKGFIELKIF